MNHHALQQRLSPLLSPISKLYAGCMALRAQRYHSKIFPSPYKASCPVVSVGNIAWGGTGKTPFVDWLLTWADENAIATVVLTRGYRATPPSFPFAIKPGDSPQEAGDEPLMLARQHPRSLVLVDPKRVRAAAWAERNALPQLFLLDDGMQHMAMGRDLDIVLLRPQDLLEDWNRVIPAGPWREGVSALHRAGALCIKADEATFSAIAPTAEERLKHLGVPLFSFHLEPYGLRRLLPAGKNTDTPVIPNLGGDAYILVSGVGSPDQVVATATALLGNAPKKHAIFPDHHQYGTQDVADLVSNKTPIVCTAKDAVKLTLLLPEFASLPVWVLEVRLHFGPTLFTSTSFPQWWADWWRNYTTRSGGLKLSEPPILL